MSGERRPGHCIPVMRPQLPSSDKLSPYLEQIDITQRYTNFGPLVQSLERGLANLLRSQEAVCLSSATMALELGVAALELPVKSIVALPSLNFPAAAHAILNNGHVPVFCDVDRATGLMRIEHVQAAIGDRKLGAILPASLNGCGYPAGYWDDITKGLGVPVLLDAAGSIGFQPAGTRTATVYSLHATKPLSSAEGGIIVSDDAEFCTRVRAMSNFGFLNSRVSYRGTNAKMSEYHAAIGLASLDGWPATSDALSRLYRTYKSALAAVGTRLRILNRSGISGTLTVAFEPGGRNVAEQALAAIGAETRNWYLPPLHRHELFSNCPRARDLATTESLGGELLGLPYGLHLSREELSAIADALGQATQ